MNNKGVKIFIAIMISFLIFPISLKAKTISKSDSTSSCSNANTRCKNEVGINIKVSGYNFDSTTTSTSIGERKITITTGDNNDAEYKAMMIIAKEEEIDEIELDERKYNNKNISELKDDLAEIEGATIKTKKFTKKLEWNLNPGYEAMVVVWLKSKYISTTTCCKKSNGTCTEYLQCKAGDFTVNGENNKKNGIKEITTTGTSAFIYVQNPSKSALTANVKKAKEICTNTWNGFYLEKNGEISKNNKFNIDSSEKGTWQSELYQRFLSYCTQPSVAFNLSDSTIRKISNNMLKIYYYQKKLENSGAKSIDIINQEINTIKADISNKYCSGNVGNCSNIITNVNDLSNRSLSCNSKDIKDLQKEEYLYIKEEAPISTKKLSNGKSYNVCNVKCYEHLTVIYSPPQVVKAGLCFNYKITIKSKTECGVQDNSDQVIKSLNKKEMCNPIPICENTESRTQAGPSEKFDKCINNCDGGKYTQSCINKCYSKIYKNNKSKKQYAVTKNKTDNTSIKDMINNNMSINSVKITNSEKCNEEDDCFKYYYNSSKVASNCTKTKIIGYVHNNKASELEKCAKYFMEAKLSNTMGHYVRRSSTAEDYEWGQWNWVPSPELGKPNMETDTMDIPNSVGRASPFYFRDLETSKKTLKSLVYPTEAQKIQQGKYWKKYNINNKGILRQFSDRFKCYETCYYAGCSAGSATSSKEYSEDLVDDLEKIANALKQCNTSSTCETTEDTSDFYIKVNTKKGKNSESVDTKINGHNKIKDVNNNVTNVGNCPTSSCEKQSKPTMFVPLANENGNGILGLCYDNFTKNPHYQTTITFPGSWINLKTGEVSYDCQNLCTYRKKDQYYCTPYNANDVNEEWAKWAIKGHDSFKYPENFSPEYNITSCLGGKLDDNGTCVKDNHGFGKYNWTVGFSCFYASYSKTVNTDDVKCYKWDAKDENDGVACIYEDGKAIPEGKSTKLQDNYDIRVSSNEAIFSKTSNGKTRFRGYNWGSQAKLKSKDATIQNALENTGYGVDPVRYSTKVMEKGQKVYDDTAEVTITLSQSQMDDLKKESLEFSGAYNNKVENIPGLYYYTMSNNFKTAYGINTNWKPGNNSETAKGAIK